MNKENENKEDSFLISPGFIDEEKEKSFLLVEIPYYERNEQLTKSFLKRFTVFTKSSYRLSIKWLTKKIKTLLPLKDRK